MSGDYYIPDGISQAGMTVRKSRFIAEAAPIDSPEDAREKIRLKREEYPGCTHVVYAFVAGDPSSEVSGMSDDGEPSGTAGAPVLDVIKGAGVFNLLVTVVRYFGGVKLGTGGLVRAYSEAAGKAVRKMPVRKYVPEISFSLEVPYRLHEKVKLVLESAGGGIASEDFSDSVLLRGKLPESQVDMCNNELLNLSGGKLSILPERK
ncbi:MAG: YigZ family protein [Candidatus Krumholzibacteriales bacterium]